MDIMNIEMIRPKVPREVHKKVKKFAVDEDLEVPEAYREVVEEVLGGKDD